MATVLSSTSIRLEIEKIKELPPLPVIAQQLLGAISDDDSSIDGGDDDDVNYMVAGRGIVHSERGRPETWQSIWERENLAMLSNIGRKWRKLSNGFTLQEAYQS